MKIAVPTRGLNVDDHFGHCEFYTVFSFDENKQILSEKIINSPVGCGCKSNIASDLAQMGVSVLLAGNIGQGAVNVLNYNGITVVRGCSGNVRKVATDWANGLIADNGTNCHHHDQHHGHDHDHSHTCNH